MNILLVDDHEVVRRGLRQMLADEIGGSGDAPLRFGEAASAAEALARLRETHWDLVILDIRMPGRSGLDVLAELRDRQPGLAVLVLSMATEGEFALQALQEGAAGYLTKETAAQELAGAVRQILAGGRYVSPAVAERIAASLVSSERPFPVLLSERERQVLCLIARGRSVKEIAAELALSEKTVFTYRDRVRDKLGLRNDADIARFALRHGLIE